MNQSVTKAKIFLEEITNKIYNLKIRRDLIFLTNILFDNVDNICVDNHKLVINCKQSVNVSGMLYKSLKICLENNNIIINILYENGLKYDVRLFSLKDKKKNKYVDIISLNNEIDKQIINYYFFGESLKYVQQSDLREYPNKKVFLEGYIIDNIAYMLKRSILNSKSHIYKNYKTCNIDMITDYKNFGEDLSTLFAFNDLIRMMYFRPIVRDDNGYDRVSNFYNQNYLVLEDLSIGFDKKVDINKDFGKKLKKIK